MSNESSGNPGCLGLILKLFGISPHESATGSWPYRLRDDFLSPAEISFYHVLKSATGDAITVCPKVNLSDIFFVSGPGQNQGAKNRISRKHVDFLLCDSQTMRPRVGVELDDSSHAREDRQTRDALVQQVFDAAGLALLRFPAQRAYDLSEIVSRLSQSLSEEPAPPAPTAPPTPQDATSSPICPKCGIPLVIRSGSRGKFYGCSNYPKCRETVPIP